MKLKEYGISGYLKNAHSLETLLVGRHLHSAAVAVALLASDTVCPVHFSGKIVRILGHALHWSKRCDQIMKNLQIQMVLLPKIHMILAPRLLFGEACHRNKMGNQAPLTIRSIYHLLL